MIYLVMTAHHPDGGSAGLMVATFDPAAWLSLLHLPNVVRLHNAIDMRLKVPIMMVDGVKQDLIGLRGRDLIEAVAYGVPADAGAAAVYGEPARFEFFGMNARHERPGLRGDVVLLAELPEFPLEDNHDHVVVVPERRTLKKPSLPQSRYAH